MSAIESVSEYFMMRSTIDANQVEYSTVKILSRMLVSVEVVVSAIVCAFPDHPSKKCCHHQ